MPGWPTDGGVHWTPAEGEWSLLPFPDNFLRAVLKRNFLFFLWGNPLRTAPQHPTLQVAFPLLKRVVLRSQKKSVFGEDKYLGGEELVHSLSLSFAFSSQTKIYMHETCS